MSSYFCRHAVNVTPSSIACAAPCATNGNIGWQASPSSVTLPTDQRASGARSNRPQMNVSSLPETEMAFDFYAERRSQQSVPVVPALLMHGHGHHAEAGELVAQAQAMNHASCVWRHVDASADFA